MCVSPAQARGARCAAQAGRRAGRQAGRQRTPWLMMCSMLPAARSPQEATGLGAFGHKARTLAPPRPPTPPAHTHARSHAVRLSRAFFPPIPIVQPPNRPNRQQLEESGVLPPASSSSSSAPSPAGAGGFWASLLGSLPFGGAAGGGSGSTARGSRPVGGRPVIFPEVGWSVGWLVHWIGWQPKCMTSGAAHKREPGRCLLLWTAALLLGSLHMCYTCEGVCRDGMRRTVPQLCNQAPAPSGPGPLFSPPAPPRHQQDDMRTLNTLNNTLLGLGAVKRNADSDPV